MTQIVQQDFPRSLPKVRSLVRQHLKIGDEPLLLAVYFASDRAPEDVFLFEIVQHFGGDAVDPDRKLFEVAYRSRPELLLNPEQQLHLILTNPTEFKAALAEGWPSLGEIREALSPGRYRVIHQSAEGRAMLECLGG